MSSQERLTQAYQMGALLAAQRCGLEKIASFGVLGKAMPEILGQIGRAGEGMHPAVSRALIGGGLGATGGAMSDDIGAGRGALAGALAGAGSHYGSRYAQKAYKDAWKKGVKDIGAERKAISQRDIDRRFAEHQHLFGRTSGVNPDTNRFGKMPAWHRNLETAGTTGGLGLGALAGGGALLATNPSKPKHWWE